MNFLFGLTGWWLMLQIERYLPAKETPWVTERYYDNYNGILK